MIDCHLVRSLPSMLVTLKFTYISVSQRGEWQHVRGA